MSDRINLAGDWAMALDREHVGIRERWYERELTERMPLPGTTDEAQLGDFVDEACADRLSRVWRWIGPAWYQRRVTIPADWAETVIQLHLERTKNSQVWVDGRWMGGDDSLSTPHEFDLSAALTPGEHTLTVLVDNSLLPPVGPCHQVDERTQTNWNGILGAIELRSRARVWIRDLQAAAHPTEHALVLTAELMNETNWSGAGHFRWQVELLGDEAAGPVATRETGTLVPHGGKTLTETLALPASVACWDEFDPTLLRVTLESRTMPQARWLTDRRSVVCGLRRFGTARGQFTINGRPTHLRGKLDCAIFPLTGYAPMDKAEWLRLMAIAKDYGINHYRFHSWCPPRAAFEAADELGIYLLAELPNKREITAPDNHSYKPPAAAYETLVELEGDGGPPAARTAYLYREGERILRAYGNHPSFCMFTLGNELGGNEAVMRDMTAHFRQLDGRRLYAMGSGHFHWDIHLHEGDEFWVTRATRPGQDVRGASVNTLGHIDHRPPSTTVDYRDELLGVPIPVVAHEIAQFEVYPDYREIAKYTGVLRARNLEIFRDRLRAAGMLDQADAFFRASGALSVICHREEVEANLRTPGMGGFQLLDIQDFSGQGTALVGILDVFMESKGLITPAAWRQFCCETVPLLWMTKYTWTNAETFHGRILVSHYGPRPLAGQVVQWRLMDGDHVWAAGETRPLDMAPGTVPDVDLFSCDLSGIDRARKLRVALRMPGTPYQNSYDIWVYPAMQPPRPPASLRLARDFGAETRQALAAGETVLLIPEPRRVKKTVAMAFQTGFWSCMFRMGNFRAPDGREVPGTQGILCDPAHPIFDGFPTEFHGNWQWWQLLKHSDPLVLDDTDPSYRPILQVIDGFDRNHKLGLLLEARVGAGKLLICCMDLPSLQAHPEARQLLAGIYAYADSAAFDPRHELTPELLQTLL